MFVPIQHEAPNEGASAVERGLCLVYHGRVTLSVLYGGHIVFGDRTDITEITHKYRYTWMDTLSAHGIHGLDSAAASAAVSSLVGRS